MLLKVTTLRGETLQYYLQPGLTIGRDVGATIQLDEDGVDLLHARVDFMVGGQAIIRSLRPGGLIACGKPQTLLDLRPGLSFQIGSAVMACVSGMVAEHRNDVVGTRLTSKCPFCDSANIQAFKCASCSRDVIVIQTLHGKNQTIVLPRVYGAFAATSFVARGGMGIVLKGKRVGDNTPVAIKLLNPSDCLDRSAQERFRREISTMARVEHPNVLRLLTFGRTGHFSYLVSEWQQNGSIRDAILRFRAGARLPSFETVIVWLRQIGEGLKAIHEAGLIHRVLKPENILLNEEFVAVIAEIGIVRDCTSDRSLAIATGIPVGAIDYMAPEQREGAAELNPRSDLYSLGIVAYELLTLSRPIGAWKVPSQLNTSVPIWFDPIVASLLASRPQDRPGSAAEFLALLPSSNPPIQAVIMPVAERTNLAGHQVLVPSMFGIGARGRVEPEFVVPVVGSPSNASASEPPAVPQQSGYDPSGFRLNAGGVIGALVGLGLAIWLEAQVLPGGRNLVGMTGLLLAPSAGLGNYLWWKLRK